jgi:hypothetical protein
MPTLLPRLGQTAFIGLFATLFIIFSVSTECYKCDTPATIRDLQGQAGCGLVLELPTGQWLEPSGGVWLRFDKANGRRVRVGYRPLPTVGECLAGQAVEITCIMADGK